MKLLPKIIVIFLFVSVVPVGIFSGLGVWAIAQHRSDIISVLATLFLVFAFMALFFALQFARYLTYPITSLKSAAEKIRSGQLKERVSFSSKDELGELSESFNAMASKIEETDRIKTNFISLASHHLRTPQTIISLAAGELSNNTSGMNDVQKKYLELLLGGVNSLSDINETLLVLSEAQMGGTMMKRETADLVQIVNGAASKIKPALEKKNLQLVVTIPNEPATIQTDPRLLRTALDLLLDNAVHFTQTGQVEIKLERDPKWFYLRVIDTGIGVPTDQIEHLFGEFYQAENAKAVNPTGKGLGLYLARQVVRLLGGEIDAAPRSGGGSVFTIMLPIV